jgi:hypothetical protein
VHDRFVSHPEKIPSRTGHLGGTVWDSAFGRGRYFTTPTGRVRFGVRLKVDVQIRASTSLVSLSSVAADESIGNMGRAMGENRITVTGSTLAAGRSGGRFGRMGDEGVTLGRGEDGTSPGHSHWYESEVWGWANARFR